VFLDQTDQGEDTHVVTDIPDTEQTMLGELVCGQTIPTILVAEANQYF
jgi:hypothetical protein